jgi:hypothetical protein
MIIRYIVFFSEKHGHYLAGRIPGYHKIGINYCRHIVPKRKLGYSYKRYALERGFVYVYFMIKVAFSFLL